MEMFIVLIVGSPIVLGLWLIVRAISAKSSIEELSRRVDELQAELLKLKHSPPSANKIGEENFVAFTPAALPPRRQETEKPANPLETQPADEPVLSSLPLPQMPVPPKMQAIAPRVFGEAAASQTLPPATVKPAEPTSNPPIITAKTESAPPPDPLSAAEKASFEMRLGTFWLVRVGIVMLLTGFAFFANFAYHHVVPLLGPVGKISLLYLASGLLLGAGAWWQRRSVKESLKNYAQVLFAGGLAAVYFTTYAAHHIPPLRVIESATVDGTLLLAWAGVIAWIADRRKSEVMALFAVGLAFYSSVITRVGDFTLYSNLILTVAAVVFLIRNRWVSLSFAGLATSYAGYAFWRFLHEDGWRWAAPDERLYFGAAFLATYWLVFTAATFLSRSEKLSGRNRATFLTLNNGAFFALFILTMIQVQSGGFWKVCLGYGAGLVALAGLAKKMIPGEPPAKNAYLTQGLLLVTLGFISKFTGLQLALVLGMESVVLFSLGTQRQSLILKFFSFATAALATVWCVSNLNRFETHGLWIGAGLGAFLIFNAFWAYRQDAERNKATLHAESVFFMLFACANWIASIWRNTADEYVPIAFMVAATGVFVFALWQRNREALVVTAVFAVVSIISLWAQDEVVMITYWSNLLSLLALLAMQQIIRRTPEKLSLDEQIHAAIIFAGGVSLWRLATCWADTFTGGFFITMIWAGFAVLVFTAGMTLRERFHRWLGLGVLAAAVGRVVLVDVWKQETIFRVVTFMALGVALLVIGFIYNKYQETIRKWL